MRWIGITAFSALLCLSAPAKAELVVNISKSQQQLVVTVDGAQTYRWPVSTGRRGFETPAGTFHPIRLERHWYSHKYEMSPMPWSVFFFGGYAMHGTIEAYNLGHAASHGCVRLRPDNASTLFSLVRKQGYGHTKIVVMNGPLPAAPGAVPMANAATPKAETVSDEYFANALPEDDADDTGGAVAPRHEAKAERLPRPGADARDDRTTVSHSARTARHRMAWAGDEAAVLRDREAWLRSLDRKYGIAR